MGGIRAVLSLPLERIIYMGYLHITGGTVRNRKIIGPSCQNTRPMQSFLRKTVFDLMPIPLHDTIIWDLFAGSGAIGLEALSRGAAKAFFVEKDPKMVALIHRNIDLCGFRNSSRVFKRNFFQIERWILKIEKPNIVFLDPPFSLDPKEVLEKMKTLDRALEGTLIIIRYAKNCQFSIENFFTRVFIFRVYGESVLVFGYF